jgi:hypothetical protein
MKKTAIFIICFIFTASLGAFAQDISSPDIERQEHRLEAKKVKAQQREARKSGPSAADKKWSDFWAKEGERSGLGNTGERMGKVLSNLNPAPFFKSQQAQYEARKAAAKKT